MNEEATERLLWAPLIGNGVALVTLGGIIGNVDASDLALKSLSFPLAIFSVGVLTGAWCAWTESIIQSNFARLGEFRSRLQDLNIHRKDIEAKLQELKWRQDATLIRDLSQLMFEIQSLKDESADAEEKSSRLNRDVSYVESQVTPFRRGMSDGLKNASLSCFATGLIWIGLSLFDGSIHLEEPKPVEMRSPNQNAPAVASATPLVVSNRDNPIQPIPPQVQHGPTNRAHPDQRP